MDLLCVIFDDKIQLAPIIGATIAAFVVVIGWFIISYLNRKNEIAKETRSYKMDMYISTYGFMKMFHDKMTQQDNMYLHSQEFKNITQEITGKIAMFGTAEELKCWEGIGYALIESDVDKFNQNFSKWERFIQNGVKKELNI